MGGAASLQLAGPAASSQPNGGGRIHQNSTLYQHSKNQQLHQNHLYIEFRFDFWDPSITLLCKCEGHEASAALHATCRTLRVKVQVQQDAHICVRGGQ